MSKFKLAYLLYIFFFLNKDKNLLSKNHWKYWCFSHNITQIIIIKIIVAIMSNTQMIQSDNYHLNKIY